MDFGWSIHQANMQNRGGTGKLMLSLFDDYKWFVNSTEYQRLVSATWREIGEGRPCYPHPSKTFRAFYDTPLEHTKVVIIGLDPYPRPQHPIGRSFAIPQHEGEKSLPSSLRNIKQELKSDVDVDLTDYELNGWVNQGVLMMNAKLSVGDRPQSHAHLEWEKFTGPLVTYLTEKSKHPIVFLLWGTKAQQFGQKYISTKVHNHIILKTTHPCRYSASKGFLGSRIFSKCNDALEKLNLPPVAW